MTLSQSSKSDMAVIAMIMAAAGFVLIALPLQAAQTEAAVKTTKVEAAKVEAAMTEALAKQSAQLWQQGPTQKIQAETLFSFRVLDDNLRHRRIRTSGPTFARRKQEWKGNKSEKGEKSAKSEDQGKTKKL